MKEIREMIRDLVFEIYKKKQNYIANKKHVNMIVERIVYKINPNNIPEIEELKLMIEKEFYLLWSYPSVHDPFQIV